MLGEVNVPEYKEEFKDGQLILGCLGRGGDGREPQICGGCLRPWELREVGRTTALWVFTLWGLHGPMSAGQTVPPMQGLGSMPCQGTKIP